MFDWRIFHDYLRLLITLQLYRGLNIWCFISLVFFLRPGLNCVGLIFLWTSFHSRITIIWTILPSLADISLCVTVPNLMSFIIRKEIPYKLMSLLEFEFGKSPKKLCVILTLYLIFEKSNLRFCLDWNDYSLKWTIQVKSNPFQE